MGPDVVDSETLRAEERVLKVVALPVKVIGPSEPPPVKELKLLVASCI